MTWHLWLVIGFAGGVSCMSLVVVYTLAKLMGLSFPRALGMCLGWTEKME